MTRAEAERIMASPEYKDSGRVAVFAYEDGADFVVEAQGREFRAGNMFGLDSKLEGYFGKRNVFLVSKDESDNVPILESGEA